MSQLRYPKAGKRDRESEWLAPVSWRPASINAMQIRTKIVVTLGPATDEPGVVEAMIEAGMRVARFNFSHGSLEEHAQRARLVREASAKLHCDVALLQDLQGPKVRLGRFIGGGVQLAEGESFVLTTEPVSGDETRASVDYPRLPGDLSEGADILLADGTVRLRVERIAGSDLYCRVINGGRIADRQGVNVPGSELRIPALTEKDREDLAQGAHIGFDYIALSFVQRPNDVTDARQLAREYHSGAKVIAKIEKPKAIERFWEILKVSDGIMLARGDLGVEVEAERVPIIQKHLISICNRAGKPVITATQMLQSMIASPRATRAETSDVANAIFDGSDAVMLSAETSIGRYPLQAVRYMADIAAATESSAAYDEVARLHVPSQTGSVQDACARAACDLARNIRASLIVCLTKGGSTARAISANRPSIPIIAAGPDASVRRSLALYHGVHTRDVAFPAGADTDVIIQNVLAQARREGWAKPGDRIVFTAGLPFDRTGGTNLIRIETL